MSSIELWFERVNRHTAIMTRLSRLPCIVAGVGRGVAARSAHRSSSSAAGATSRLLPLTFVPAGVCFKEPSKPGLGEDAWFAGPQALGVADGVGGFAQQNIDSGKYSRALMREVEGYCAAAENVRATPLAAAALEHAHHAVRVAGASTACVAVARRDGLVDVVNVGDSGLQLWRRTQPLTRGPLAVGEAAKLWTLVEQVGGAEHGQHWFNCPHQLEAGHYSDNVRNRGIAGTLRPRSGDLIVAATDGVLDNLGPNAIAAVLGRFAFDACAQLARWRRVSYYDAAAASAGAPPVGIAEGGTGVPLEARRLLASAPDVVTPAGLAAQEKDCRALLTALATSLALTAQRVGDDRGADTPYARASKLVRPGTVFSKHVPPHEHWHGGKPDDATVVVALCVTSAFEEGEAATPSKE